MNEGARQANEDMWRRQMLAELQAIKNALQKEEPKPDSLQQLKPKMPSFDTLWNRSRTRFALADYEWGCRKFYSELCDFLSEKLDTSGV